MKEIDGIDYQILIESDYIANATENGYRRDNIENFMSKMMKTESGKRLTKDGVFTFIGGVEEAKKPSPARSL